MLAGLKNYKLAAAAAAALIVLSAVIWVFFVPKYEIDISISAAVETNDFYEDGVFRRVTCPTVRINISDPHFPVGSGTLEEQLEHLFIKVDIVLNIGFFEAIVVWNHTAEPNITTIERGPEGEEKSPAFPVYVKAEFHNDVVTLIIALWDGWIEARVVVDVQCSGGYDGHAVKNVKSFSAS